MIWKPIARQTDTFTVSFGPPCEATITLFKTNVKCDSIQILKKQQKKYYGG